MKKFIVLTQQFTTRTFEVEAPNTEEAGEYVLSFNGDTVRPGVQEIDIGEEIILSIVEDNTQTPVAKEFNNELLKFVEDFMNTKEDNDDITLDVVVSVMQKIVDDYSIL